CCRRETQEAAVPWGIDAAFKDGAALFGKTNLLDLGRVEEHGFVDKKVRELAAAVVEVAGNTNGAAGAVANGGCRRAGETGDKHDVEANDVVGAVVVLAETAGVENDLEDVVTGWDVGDVEDGTGA